MTIVLTAQHLPQCLAPRRPSENISLDKGNESINQWNKKLSKWNTNATKDNELPHSGGVSQELADHHPSDIVEDPGICQNAAGQDGL